MYKIVFVVVVIAFALQSANSSPVDTEEVSVKIANPNWTKPAAALMKTGSAMKPEEPTTVAPETQTSTEPDEPSSASSTDFHGSLLILASTVALVATHVCYK